MPPPPPPPPPPSFIQRLPTTPGDSATLFANVRANLKHAGTPTEAPINGLPKRKGQPTVNISADKMVAFLTEMKTVRLRKVPGGPADLVKSDKRKRDSHDDSEIQSIKRRLTEVSRPARPSDSGFQLHSQSFSGLPSDRPAAGPSTLSRSFSYLPARNWPSSSVDGTDVTPSLTSDNDHEDTSPDDRVPRTPPPAPASLPQPTIASLDIRMASPQRKRPSTPVSSPPQQPAAKMNLFASRVPRSPMGDPTPRKPRPPRRVLKPPTAVSDEEADDPASQPFAFPRSPSPAPPPIMDLRAKRSMVPKAAPKRGGAAATKLSRAETELPVRTRVLSNKVVRRRTLDEELLLAADGVDEEDLRDIDFDANVLVGVGQRSQKKGFLAHGGAGGIPVFMGKGYVEGAEREETRPRRGRAAR